MPQVKWSQFAKDSVSVLITGTGWQATAQAPAVGCAVRLSAAVGTGLALGER